MTEDGFEATFVIDLSPEEAWEALTLPVLGGAEAQPPNQYVVPGFPGGGDHGEGALCTELELDPAEMARFHADLELGRRIAASLREIGFRFVALDLEGYRTGSFNPTDPG